MAENTLEMAKQIRLDQGPYETEVTCNGERDLHRTMIMCDKNPGHHQFIPVPTFGMQHLPPRYQFKVMVDWVKAKCDLTVRISTPSTSEDRPLNFPESNQAFPFYHHRNEAMSRYGTGWVARVMKYDEPSGKLCRCFGCREKDEKDREKTWAQIYIITARHVVFDNNEARGATCHFFYDHGSIDLESVMSITEMEMVDGDVKGDYIMLRHNTHDTTLVDKLDSMVNEYLRLCGIVGPRIMQEMRNRYGKEAPGEPCDTDEEDRLVIIISHPHGCAKQVSMGKWRDKQTIEVREEALSDGSMAKGEISQYTYDAPTCCGSSGAPVFTLVRGWWFWWWNHPHCKGAAGNSNACGSRWEPYSNK